MKAGACSENLVSDAAGPETFTLGELLRLLEGVKLRNERAARSHQRRRAARRTPAGTLSWIRRCSTGVSQRITETAAPGPARLQRTPLSTTSAPMTTT